MAIRQFSIFNKVIYIYILVLRNKCNEEKKKEEIKFEISLVTTTSHHYTLLTNSINRQKKG